MSEDAVIELRQLRDQVAALVAHVSPFVGTDEMCIRYDCTPRTLNNMERAGKIPFRQGTRWSRVALMEFEKKLS